MRGKNNQSKPFYYEVYVTLNDIDKYLNREVLRKEILRERLLSELSFKQYTPSKEMINTTKKFITHHIKNLSNNNPPDTLASYVKTFGNTRKIKPEYIQKQKEFLKSRGHSPERTAPDTEIPVIGKSDIKNLNLIYKTIKYLTKHKDPIISDYKKAIKSSIDKVFPTKGKFLKKLRNKLFYSLFIPEVFSDSKKSLKNHPSPYYSTLNHYINMSSMDNKNPLTLGHELTHSITGSEILADIGGAYSYLGQPDSISDKQAIDAAKNNYKGLRKINKHLGNDWYWFKKRFKNYFRPKSKKEISDRTDDDILHARIVLKKRIHTIQDYLKNNKDTITNKEFLDKELDNLLKSYNILTDAKPVRSVGNEKVYSPDVIDELYKTFSNGYSKDRWYHFHTHPAPIIRSYEILHALRPDIFTRDGIDKRTGKPVPFTLGEKISDQLHLAKAISKTTYTRVKNKIKKSLSNFNLQTPTVLAGVS